MTKKEIESLPNFKAPVVCYQTISEIFKEVDDRLGVGFIKQELRRLIKNSLRDDFFCDFGGFEGHFYIIDPRKIDGVRENETIYTFSQKIRANTGLMFATASSIWTICLNFQPNLFQRKTMVTKFIQIKGPHKSWVHSIFEIGVDPTSGRPILSFVGYNPTDRIRMDVDYLFMKNFQISS